MSENEIQYEIEMSEIECTCGADAVEVCEVCRAYLAEVNGEEIPF